MWEEDESGQQDQKEVIVRMAVDGLGEQEWPTSGSLGTDPT